MQIQIDSSRDKIVYGTHKHFRRVSCEEWSYYVYFIAVKPFLTATFLDIAVSRDFSVFWIFLGSGGRYRQIQRDTSRDKSCIWHI